MLCDGRPDSSQTQEVNTYISLWRDDPEVDAVPALQQCSLALQVRERVLLDGQEHGLPPSPEVQYPVSQRRHAPTHARSQ